MNLLSVAEHTALAACPSIQYRIRREIFGVSPELMCDLEDQILSDDSVRTVAASQGADGWLGLYFHGYNSMESGIRLLCEKGVEADRPVLARALNALENRTDRLESGLGTAGKILDDLGFGGGETIRASLFAQAGREEIYFVREQTQSALDVFEFAARARSLDEISAPNRTGLVFRQGVCWPSIYHLRLLAWAKNWRTESNCKLMVRSIQNLMRLSPLPDIRVKYKSQIIAPASFCMHDFAPDMEKLSAAAWMQWFHRMELLSRLGIVDQIPALQSQVQALKGMLAENHGVLVKKLNHPYFQKWGAYTGLALEKDWRSAQRRINDLTFRSLLILHYSGL